MTLQRPRRIFRPSTGARLGLVAASGAAVVAASALLAAGASSLAPRFPAVFATRAPPTTGHLDAAGTEVAIIDGGTLRMERTVVRLLGVQPPPRGQACGEAVDCGSAAANAVAGLIRGKPVGCEVHGRDELGRALAVCQAAGSELNRALVAAGWARADGSVPALRDAESEARAGRRGLWSSR